MFTHTMGGMEKLLTHTKKNVMNVIFIRKLIVALSTLIYRPLRKNNRFNILPAESDVSPVVQIL